MVSSASVDSRKGLPRPFSKRVSAARIRPGSVHPPRASSDIRTVLIATPVAAALMLGVAVGNGPLALIASFVAIATAIASPAVGLVILAFVAPAVTRPILPTPGLNAVLVAGIILGSIYRLPIDRPRIAFGPPILLLLGLFLFVFAQQLPAMLAGYAGDATDTGSLFLRLLTGVGAVVAAALVLRDRSPYPFLAILIASAVVAAALATLMFGNPTIGAPLANFVAQPDANVRPSGAFSNPNYYGWFIAIVMVVTLGLLQVVRRGRLFWALLPVMFFLGIGIAVSQSRGAFMSLFAGAVSLAFARSRQAGLATLAIGVVLAVVIVPLLIEWRLTNSIGSASDYAFAQLAESDAGRLSAVAFGPALWATSPIFGIGLGGYLAATGDASHNWYMSVLAEQGSVGIVLWILLLVAIAIALRPRPTLPRSIGYGVLGVLVVASLFLEPPLETQGSIPTALILTAALVATWRVPQRDELSVRESIILRARPGA